MLLAAVRAPLRGMISTIAKSTHAKPPRAEGSTTRAMTHAAHRRAEALVRGGAAFRAVLLLCGLIASPVAAQIPHLDRLPWFEAQAFGSTDALQIAGERQWDRATGWLVDRVGLEGFLQTSETGWLFLRLHYATFDSDGLRALERWPQIDAATAGDSTNVWPYEDRVAGLVRPEVGLLTSFGLPGLGTVGLGFAAALPVGRDELYPQGGVSVPLRAEARVARRLGNGITLGTVLGGLVHLDSAGEDLTPEAFPGGWHGHVDLHLQLAARHHLVLDYIHAEFDGRIADRVGVALWIPSGAYDFVGLAWNHELTGTEHRAIQNSVRVVFRFVRRPSNDEGPDGRRGPRRRDG